MPVDTMSAMSSPTRRLSPGRWRIEQLDPAELGRDLRSLDRRALRRGLRRLAVSLLRIAALVAIDGVAVAFALYLSLLAKQLVRGADLMPGLMWRIETTWLPFVLLVVVLVLARNGLYRARDERPGGGEMISALAFATLVVAVFALATGHRFQSYAVFPTTFAFASLLLPLLREAYDGAAIAGARLLRLRRSVIVCGRGATQHSLEARHPGFELDVTRVEPAALAAAIERIEPYEVLIGENPETETLLSALEASRRVGAHLRAVPAVADVMARRLIYVPGQGAPLLDLHEPSITGPAWLSKRTFDVVVASVMLVLLSPVLLAIALAVKATSRGPILYRDQRIGIGERPFSMLKFRSMRDGAADEQSDFEEANEADGALFKIRNDPRVTPVGRILRRLSLDEFPQLLNVVRGEMSLVGPRPLPMRDYERLADWHRRRYLVLPGVTGPWQIAGRSHLGFDDMVRLDFHYLEHWSIWLDIAILARTPAAVILGRGAY